MEWSGVILSWHSITLFYSHLSLTNASSRESRDLSNKLFSRRKDVKFALVRRLPYVWKNPKVSNARKGNNLSDDEDYTNDVFSDDDDRTDEKRDEDGDDDDHDHADDDIDIDGAPKLAVISRSFIAFSLCSNWTKKFLKMNTRIVLWSNNTLYTRIGFLFKRNLMLLAVSTKKLLIVECRRKHYRYTISNQ